MLALSFDLETFGNRCSVYLNGAGYLFYAATNCLISPSYVCKSSIIAFQWSTSGFKIVHHAEIAVRRIVYEFTPNS